MIECARCGNKVNFYMQEKGSQTGLYCKECMRWQKWVGKKDIKGYQMRGIPMVAEGVAVIPQQPEKHEGDVGIELMGFKEEDKGRAVESVAESVAEVERLKEEIRKQKEEIRELNGIIKEREQEKTKDGCGVCNGLESLEAIQTEVDISIYSGVLTVTSENGENVKGVYPIKYCINCGKKFE